MNEIEKLYRLANIESFIHNQPVKDYNFGGHDGYKYNEVKCYPPFSAEKQLELIKWLIQKYKTVSIEHKLNLFYINIIDIYTGMVHIEFDETIAGLINNLWQDLTEEEQTEIRKILEG